MDDKKLKTLNAVREHLRKQNIRAYSEDLNACVYRGPGGTKCAIGGLIPDDKYNPIWDSSVVALCSGKPQVAEILAILGDEGYSTDLNFLCRLQSIHDSQFEDREIHFANLERDIRGHKKLKTLNAVREHLLKQKVKSERDGICRYRGPGGLKCAIGALIPDDKYNPRWDVRVVSLYGFDDDDVEKQALKSEILAVLDAEGYSTDLKFLGKLQDIHDDLYSSIDKWQSELKKLEDSINGN